MSSRPSLEKALATATLVHGREKLMPQIERLGREIARDYAGRVPLFMTVMNGGLVFGGHLALAIAIDCEFDYVHATRYRGKTSGGSLRWVKAPQVDLTGRSVLLVDDILDEGHTLLGVRDYCLSQGATDVKLAVLCVKVHDRRAPGIVADYVGVEVPDRYVFGFGMDFSEQGRNLPGIYALAE